jgi:hypothetical protein
LVQIEQLKKWFWITTYSNYFTIYSLSKQRQAFNQFKDFINGITDDPTFNDKPNIPFSVTEFPKNIYFGSVRAKALVLFLLNFSNGFQSIDSEEVDELKINYLFKERSTPEGVVPLISYIAEQSYKNTIQTKHKDLSFFFESDRFNDFADKFFLDEIMISLFMVNDLDAALRIRKALIKRSEADFVESLGLQYE